MSRYHSFVESADNGMLTMGYTVTDAVVEPHSDTAMVMAGYASVSSLVGPTSVDCADLVSRVTEEAA